MESKDMEFMASIYSKVIEIEQMIIENGYEDQVLSAIVIGFIDKEEAYSDSDMVNMRTMFSYNLDDELELEAIKSVMDDTYEAPDDMSDFFDDLGISLN
jgi:hypothetical protein